MKIIQIALAALALSLTNTGTAQDLQNQLIGTWDFVVAQVKAHAGPVQAVDLDLRQRLRQRRLGCRCCRCDGDRLCCGLWLRSGAWVVSEPGGREATGGVARDIDRRPGEFDRGSVDDRFRRAAVAAKQARDRLLSDPAADPAGG